MPPTQSILDQAAQRHALEIKEYFLERGLFLFTDIHPLEDKHVPPSVIMEMVDWHQENNGVIIHAADGFDRTGTSRSVLVPVLARALAIPIDPMLAMADQDYRRMVGMGKIRSHASNAFVDCVERTMFDIRGQTEADIDTYRMFLSKEMFQVSVLPQSSGNMSLRIGFGMGMAGLDNIPKAYPFTGIPSSDVSWSGSYLDQADDELNRSILQNARLVATLERMCREPLDPAEEAWLAEECSGEEFFL